MYPDVHTTGADPNIRDKHNESSLSAYVKSLDRRNPDDPNTPEESASNEVIALLYNEIKTISEMFNKDSYRLFRAHQVNMPDNPSIAYPRERLLGMESLSELKSMSGMQCSIYKTEVLNRDLVSISTSMDRERQDRRLNVRVQCIHPTCVHTRLQERSDDRGYKIVCLLQ